MSKEEETALVVQEGGAVPAGNLLAVIAQAVADPRMDVEKMSKLLDMHERIMADQRRTAYMAAMARVAIKLPEIGRLGESHHGKYARLEDIDRAIRPIISEAGLSMSFDSAPVDGKIRVTCKLSHSAGYAEEKHIDLPLDTSGSKNGAQSVISTVSYGRRALTKMFFNLVEASEDDDGNGGPEPLTDDQVKDIETMLVDAKANRKKFLEYMKAGRIEDIRQSDYAMAVNALQAKIRAGK